jgi:hypothetical protein
VFVESGPERGNLTAEQVSKTCQIIKIFERNRFTLLFVTYRQTMTSSPRKEEMLHKNVRLKLRSANNGKEKNVFVSSEECPNFVVRRLT